MPTSLPYGLLTTGRRRTFSRRIKSRASVIGRSGVVVIGFRVIRSPTSIVSLPGTQLL